MLTLHDVDTPIGAMMAAWSPDGLALLEFHDRFSEERNRKVLSRRFPGVEIRTGEPSRDLVQSLQAYFSGQTETFDLPLDTGGTPFQRSVWSALRRIPWGSTLSYQALAEAVGRPTASRAVARANGQNPLAIVVPCHRVIGSDGSLTGYGGGLWRKAWLLKLEGRANS